MILHFSFVGDWIEQAASIGQQN